MFEDNPFAILLGAIPFIPIWLFGRFVWARLGVSTIHHKPRFPMWVIFLTVFAIFFGSIWGLAILFLDDDPHALGVSILSVIFTGFSKPE